MRINIRQFFLLSFFSSSAFAQTADANPISPLASLTQVGVGLLLTLSAIAMLAWMVKRMGINRVGHNQIFSMLAQLPLGQREKLVLVDVKGTQFLLSICPGSITSLHVFDGLETSGQHSKNTDQVESDITSIDRSIGNIKPNSIKHGFADQLKVMMASGKIR